MEPERIIPANLDGDELWHRNGEYVAAVAYDEAMKSIAELKATLRELRLIARILLQNAEGCAVNHYGEDYQLHGEPGWLRDCRSGIERAEAALG